MKSRNEAEYRRILTELNRTLFDSTESATRDRINLRDAVCAYIAAEQARGTSLGKITQIVKDILAKAEDAATGAAAPIGLCDDDLAQQLVDWCGEFYSAGEANA